MFLRSTPPRVRLRNIARLSFVRLCRLFSRKFGTTLACLVRSGTQTRCDSERILKSLTVGIGRQKLHRESWKLYKTYVAHMAARLRIVTPEGEQTVYSILQCALDALLVQRRGL